MNLERLEAALTGQAERLAVSGPVTYEATDEGSFTGMAYVFGSVAEALRGPTIFKPGAFKEALSQGGKIPLLWQHDDHEPIGVVETLAETTEGLQIRGRIALSERGKDAIALLKMGALTGLSLGFTPDPASITQEKLQGQMVRAIGKASVKEISVVTFPADRQARVRTVHAEAPAELVEALEGMSTESLEVIADVVAAVVPETERHAGRVFSSENLSKIKAALGALVDLVTKVEPDHVASIGEGIAKSMKRSFMFVADEAHSEAADALREIAMDEAALATKERLGMGYPCDPCPMPARTFSQIRSDQEMRESRFALFDSIASILDDPTVAKKADLIRSSVEQFITETKSSGKAAK